MLIFIVHISTSLCWKIDMSNFVDCEICFDTRALLLSIAVIFLWHHEFRNLIKGKGGNWLTPHTATLQFIIIKTMILIIFGLYLESRYVWNFINAIWHRLSSKETSTIFLRFVTAVMASQIKPQQVYLEKYHIICICIYILSCSLSERVAGCGDSTVSRSGTSRSPLSMTSPASSVLQLPIVLTSPRIKIIESSTNTLKT